MPLIYVNGATLPIKKPVITITACAWVDRHGCTRQQTQEPGTPAVAEPGTPAVAAPYLVMGAKEMSR